MHPDTTLDVIMKYKMLSTDNEWLPKANETQIEISSAPGMDYKLSQMVSKNVPYLISNYHAYAMQDIPGFLKPCPSSSIY